MWIFFVMGILAVGIILYIIFGMISNKDKFNEYIHDNVKIGKVDKIKKLTGYAYSVIVTLEKENSKSLRKK